MERHQNVLIEVSRDVFFKLIEKPPILRNIKVVWKRFSVTSHACGFFVFIIKFLSYRHRDVRISEQFNVVIGTLQSKRRCTHGNLPLSSYDVQLTSSAISALQHCYRGVPEVRSTVCRAIFMTQEVHWRRLVPSAFAWVKRAVTWFRNWTNFPWYILYNIGPIGRTKRLSRSKTCSAVTS
jgi:hypothetical protein